MAVAGCDGCGGVLGFQGCGRHNPDAWNPKPPPVCEEVELDVAVPLPSDAWLRYRVLDGSTRVADVVVYDDGRVDAQDSRDGPVRSGRIDDGTTRELRYYLSAMPGRDTRSRSGRLRTRRVYSVSVRTEADVRAFAFDSGCGQMNAFRILEGKLRSGLGRSRR